MSLWMMVTKISSPTPETVTLSVLAETDAPTISGDFKANINEDQSYPLQTGDFIYAGVDDVDAAMTYTASELTTIFRFRIYLFAC